MFLRCLEALLIVTTVLGIQSELQRRAEICEDFNGGAGTFWKQDDETSNARWQHVTCRGDSGGCAEFYSDLEQDPEGSIDFMLLTSDGGKDVTVSSLVSPELLMMPNATIQLRYLLHSGTGGTAGESVSLTIFRQKQGRKDSRPVLSIFPAEDDDKNRWTTISADLAVTERTKLQVVIFAYLVTIDSAQRSYIALDRVQLTGVDDRAGHLCPGDKVEDRPEINTHQDTQGGSGLGYDFFCPEEFGLFSDPHDCRYFYQCHSWLATRMPCPQGLVFSQLELQCDYPQRVPGC